MADAVFKPELVSDAKRLVRTMHYEMAIRLVRARQSQRTPANVLMIPGRSGHEEVGVIRSLDAKAKITAVDRDPEALRSVAHLGVECINIDLSQRSEGFWNTIRNRRFDIANMDLCSTASEATLAIFRTARNHVTRKGVVIGWFSYGRDNLEYYLATARGGDLFGGKQGDPKEEGIVGRVMAVTPTPRSEGTSEIRSVLTYRRDSGSMPMCSVVWQKNWADGGMPPVIEWVENEDLKLVAYGKHDPDIDLAELYATPAAKIAAWKAVRTKEKHGGLFSRLD